MALDPMAEILRKSQAVELAPNDITKQGLLDALADASKAAMLEDGKPFDYHFLALHITELSNFMSQYDKDLAGLLTELYDCGPANHEKKRSGAGKMLAFPGISMIVGTATKNLGSTISEDLWGSGFMARVIMVFSTQEIIPRNMFEVTHTDDAIRDELVLGLKRIGELKGPMLWTPKTQERALVFRLTAKAEGPLHNRLENYSTRRWMHYTKLCMIAALSDERMTIDDEDCSIALRWLHDAEHDMVEVFKDMVQHTDGAVYEEFRMHFFVGYMTSRKPVPHSEMVKWLANRVSSYTIQRMIEIAVSADFFRRVAGTSGDDSLYIPQQPAASIPKGVL